MAKGMDQRGDLVGAGRYVEVPGAEPLDLLALDTSEVEVALDMTALLRRILVGCHPQGKTWAQLMVEGWVVDGLEGNPRAIEDILDRIEKGRLAAASAAQPPPSIDDETARKVLEVLSVSGEGAMGE